MKCNARLSLLTIFTAISQLMLAVDHSPSAIPLTRYLIPLTANLHSSQKLLRNYYSSHTMPTRNSIFPLLMLLSSTLAASRDNQQNNFTAPFPITTITSTVRTTVTLSSPIPTYSRPPPCTIKRINIYPGKTTRPITPDPSDAGPPTFRYDPLPMGPALTSETCGVMSGMYSTARTYSSSTTGVLPGGARQTSIKAGNPGTGNATMAGGFMWPLRHGTNRGLSTYSTAKPATFSTEGPYEKTSVAVVASTSPTPAQYSPQSYLTPLSHPPSLPTSLDATLVTCAHAHTSALYSPPCPSTTPADRSLVAWAGIDGAIMYTKRRVREEKATTKGGGRLWW